jgi:Rieske Fe-S protein
MANDSDRRNFLKTTTCALGGAAGLVVVAPVIRVFLDPASKQTIRLPSEPIDLGPPDRFAIDAPPQRVEIVAPIVQDAWTSARNVVLGAAWIRRTGREPAAIDARSGICPHLGCTVTWEQENKTYLCPCHQSRFAIDGAVIPGGKSERGLDPLPVRQGADGRLKISWVVYKLGQAKSEPA